MLVDPYEVQTTRRVVRLIETSKMDFSLVNFMLIVGLLAFIYAGVVSMFK